MSSLAPAVRWRACTGSGARAHAILRTWQTRPIGSAPRGDAKLRVSRRRTRGSSSRKRLPSRAKGHAISWASSGSGRIAAPAPSSVAVCAGKCGRPDPPLAAPACARCARTSSLSVRVAERKRGGTGKEQSQRRPYRADPERRELGRAQ
jgi:hypothetical protein